MNKIEFINELSRNLYNLPDFERKEIISDYEEHFIIGKSEGRTEMEIADSLGEPRIIAKQINENYSMDNIENYATQKSTINLPKQNRKNDYLSKLTKIIQWII